MTVLSHGSMTQHGIHIVTLAGPALLIALLAAGGDVRAWLQRHNRPVPAIAVFISAGMSIAAAGIHALVAPEHFREAMIYGEFFVVSAAAQLIWAALAILWPRKWVLVIGILGNVAILVLWAVTRTIGIPLGPEAGEIEAVGLLDTVSTVFEAAVVIGCAWTLTMARLERSTSVVPTTHAPVLR